MNDRPNKKEEVMQAEINYAGFWIRVMATLIDSILFLIVTMPFIVAIYGWSFYIAEAPAPFYYLFYGPADVIISEIFPAIASIWFWSAYQATPGKMLFGIRIVDANTGKAPVFSRYIVRYLGYIVSIIPLCLGLIWVAFDTRKQGWHDHMAGTVVIYSPSKGQASTPVDVNPQS